MQDTRRRRRREAQSRLRRADRARGRVSGPTMALPNRIEDRRRRHRMRCPPRRTSSATAPRPTGELLLRAEAQVVLGGDVRRCRPIARFVASYKGCGRPEPANSPQRASPRAKAPRRSRPRGTTSCLGTIRVLDRATSPSATIALLLSLASASLSQSRHLNHAGRRSPALAGRLHSCPPAFEGAAEPACAMPRVR